MLITPQRVEMRWNNNSRRIYEGEKYKYTFEKDVFWVDLQDLPRTSGAKVLVICDICLGEYRRQYNNYMRCIKNDHKETDDVCDDCLEYFSNNKLECFKLIIDGKLKSAPKKSSGKLSDSEARDILLYLGEKLIENEEISSISELKNLSKKLIHKYKITAVLEGRTIYENIKILFPDIKPWEIKTAPPHFWEDSNNILELKEWFIDKLYNDKLINSKFDLISLDLAKVCKQYGITLLFFKIFKGSKFQLADFLFPNTFVEWDFMVPNQFYKSKENQIRVIDWLLDQLIKDKKISSIDDAPNYISFNTFVDYGLRWMLITEFDCSPYKCLNFRFPDKWSPNDFAEISAKDGTIMDSKEEALIHNWLLDNFATNEINYTGTHSNKSIKFHNESHGEKYYPDWILKKNIIIEHFGYYNQSNNQHPRFLNYKEKTKRKIEYFTNLENYQFIDIYPNDLRRNLEGLKTKLSKFIEIQEAI